MAVAAFLAGLAVLLLIGYNWQGLSRETKLALIFSAVAGTHAGGLALRYRSGAYRLSEVVTFLGCLFYGAGIWLVAQVFHLDSHHPDGVFWWALGVLPFALVLDTVLLHCLLAALLALWAGMEVLGFHHLGAAFFWGWWTIPNGAYSLPLFVVPGLMWAYRKGSLTAVGLYVPLLAWWVFLQAFAWGFGLCSIHVVGAVGTVFLLIAESHRPGSRLAIPHRVFGVLLAGGVLVPLSFAEFQEEMFEERAYGLFRTTSGGAAGLLAILALLAAAIVLCARFRCPEEVGKSLRERIAALIRSQWLPVALGLSMAAMSLCNLSLGGLDDRWIILASELAFVLALLVAAALAYVASRTRASPSRHALPDRTRAFLRESRLAIAVAVCVAVAAAFGLIITISPDTLRASPDWMGVWVAPTILSNLAMVGLAIWLMRVGLREDRGRPFVAGVVYFLLWAIFRYVDLFGEWGGMLGASAMFLLCGVCLFGLSMFWRRRKESGNA